MIKIPNITPSQAKELKKNLLGNPDFKGAFFAIDFVKDLAAVWFNTSPTLEGRRTKEFREEANNNVYDIVLWALRKRKIHADESFWQNMYDVVRSRLDWGNPERGTFILETFRTDPFKFISLPEITNMCIARMKLYNIPLPPLPIRYLSSIETSKINDKSLEALNEMRYNLLAILRKKVQDKQDPLKFLGYINQILVSEYNIHTYVRVSEEFEIAKREKSRKKDESIVTYAHLSLMIIKESLLENNYGHYWYDDYVKDYFRALVAEQYTGKAPKNCAAYNHCIKNSLSDFFESQEPEIPLEIKNKTKGGLSYNTKKPNALWERYQKASPGMFRIMERSGVEFKYDEESGEEGLQTKQDVSYHSNLKEAKSRLDYLFRVAGLSEADKHIIINNYYLPEKLKLASKELGEKMIDEGLVSRDLANIEGWVNNHKSKSLKRIKNALLGNRIPEEKRLTREDSALLTNYYESIEL